MDRKKTGIVLIMTAVMAFQARAEAGPEVLVPAPVTYTLQGGTCTLAADGSDVKVCLGNKAFRRAVKDLPDFARKEAYRLTVGRKGVRIEALTEAGVFRARQSLRMMTLCGGPELPCCEILDYPRFRHRGLMIDESRTFKGKEFLKKQMDAMALLKLNSLHLHLTDAAGWRLEIRSCPELTERTAWRHGVYYEQWEKAGYPFTTADDPDAYGGFYTQDDIRELVAYAAERCIGIIPEIEMPGHSMEVNRACPAIACTGEDGQPRPFSWDLCPGNEGTFTLLEAVLTEVMDLFPSPYIHIGGDEAVMRDWPTCVNCRRRMQEEGMTDVRELQGYMMRRIEAFVRSKGRRIIGWDEIVETGLPDEAAVMSWRGVRGGREAVAAGHDVIMSPNSHCYFDYYQDLIAKEPRAVGYLTSLRHVYSFEPVVEGIAPEAAHHVLGLQANLWCELIPEGSHAEYMLYPRAFAIAEIGWSPAERRDWADFRPRARVLQDVFRTAGYNTFDLDTESERARSKVYERAWVMGYDFVVQDGGPVLSYSWASGTRVIIRDGYGFRDMNGNGALDPFEDWRLTPAERAADLSERLGTEPLYGLDIPPGADLEEVFSSGLADNPFHIDPTHYM